MKMILTTMKDHIIIYNKLQELHYSEDSLILTISGYWIEDNMDISAYDAINLVDVKSIIIRD